MKLIENWSEIAWKAHSMRANWIGLLLLVAPEILWSVFQIDTDPYWFGRLALVAFVYGIVGRLIDQKLSK